jgi:hypothetical protein
MITMQKLLATLLLTVVFASESSAQQCQSLGHCRADAPAGGALLHKPNSNGNLIWTSPCGDNTATRHADPVCEEIASCPAAGGFGKFLKSVTFNCKVKHFDGYFGLDGITFGILDWTAANIPELMRAYTARNPQKFDEVFGPLNLPMKNGCLAANWVCDANKQARFMCDAKVKDAFSKAVREPDFQKAQADVALRAYETRLVRYSVLGLKTEYGNTAMAVLGNNLVNSAACRPAAWKASCARKKDETQLVDCMLDEYVAHACRGSKRGSEERRAAIKEIFKGAQPSTILHPSAQDVAACTSKWGAGS